jgi:MOSC domain-containing protein YiiM
MEGADAPDGHVMEPPSGRIVAVCVGRAGDLTGLGRTHRSAFVKTPVVGPVDLGPLGIAGDEHVYRDHGGVDQALLVYSIDHYPFWREQVGLTLPEAGAMAENLTVAGLTESRVMIGDSFSVGEAVVQVTSPRSPCYKLGARFGNREVPRIMQDTGRTGYLMRVLESGTLAAGDAIDLIDRPPDPITVLEAARVVNRDRADWGVIERLVAAPELAAAMRTKLEARLAARDRGDDAARIYGEGEGVPVI